MNKVETIVRPFAPSDVFNARVLPPVQPPLETKPDITVNYGNPITLQLAPIGITNLFGGVKLTEKSRTTSTVRVTNPDDATQFVDVQRIESMVLTDENKQAHNFTFNNPA